MWELPLSSTTLKTPAKTVRRTMSLTAKKKIAESRHNTMAQRAAELPPSLKKELLRKETHRLSGAIKHIEHKIQIEGGGLDAHRTK